MSRVATMRVGRVYMCQWNNFFALEERANVVLYRAYWGNHCGVGRAKISGWIDTVKEKMEELGLSQYSLVDGGDIIDTGGHVSACGMIVSKDIELLKKGLRVEGFALVEESQGTSRQDDDDRWIGY